MEQAIGTIRERIDALGVSEPDIKKSGKSDIVVQLPGLGEEDFARAKRLIGTTAQLEFKMVDESGYSSFFQGVAKDIPSGEGSSLQMRNEGGNPTVTAKTKDELKKFFEGKGPGRQADRLREDPVVSGRREDHPGSGEDLLADLAGLQPHGVDG